MPNNQNFWLMVAQDENKVKAFLERGNDIQKKNLNRALKYIRWLEIQKKKEDKARKQVKVG